MGTQQKTQYTLRVKGEIHQYMQTSSSEAEARKAVAEFHLQKMGKSTADPGYQKALEELAFQGLILVYKR